jgi:glycosyltransferase involved in cell wall biosynthesis
MRQLGDGVDAQLIIVGEGTAAAELQSAADALNADLGRTAVLLTGPMIDPRPAYAAADIVLGMGGSALRAMSFGKPLIVLGEEGFSEIFDEDSAPIFLWQGYYGIGDGDRSPDRLGAQLRALIADGERRAKLGRFARGIVEERYSLNALAATLDGLYQRTVAMPREPLRTTLEAGRLLARRVVAGAIPTDLRERIRDRRRARAA